MRARQAARAPGILKLSAVICCFCRGWKGNGRVDALIDTLIKKRVKEGERREGCLPLMSSGGLRGSVLVEVGGMPAGIVPRSVISR